MALLVVGAGCSEPQANDDTLDALTELGTDIEEIADEEDEEEEGAEDDEEADEAEDDDQVAESLPVDDDADDTDVGEEPELESEEDDDAAEQEAQDLPEEDDDEEKDESLYVSMESGNFFFSPSSIAAEPGQTVVITIEQNAGTHTLVIDEIGYKSGVSIGDVLTFTAPTDPGSYAYYCDVGSHRALGMEGTLIVQ